jgi:hypothetical protein
MNPTSTAGPGKKNDNSTIALLSLYLLLLAFFILLNSISQREQTRTAAAIGSLDATFSSRKPMSFELRSVNTESATSARPDTFQVRLLQLFQTELPLARYQLVERGSVMRIVIATDTLFEKDGTDLRPSRISVLDGIAYALRSDMKNVRREVEFMIGSGSSTPSVDTPLGRLQVNRAGAFARALVKRGVPEKWIRTGLFPGDSARIRLTFYARTKNRAVIDFGNLEPAR